MSSRPALGQELELSIGSLAFGGEGVARWGEGGYVVFVAGAIPGDRVRAVVHRRKRTHAHARTVELLESSPERIPPRADHPGVPWQVLSYERQLQIKHDQVGEALRRLGKLEDFDLEEIVPAVETWRYRNKLEYSFGDREAGPVDRAAGAGDVSADRPAGSGFGELVCGFHAPAGWKRVLPIEDCLLASEQGNLARRVAERWCREQGLHAWSRGEDDEEEGEGSAGRTAPSRASGRQGQAAAAGASGRRPDGRRDGPRGRARHDPRDERTAPGPDGRARLRNLVVREGRRAGKLQVRLVSTEGELDVASLAAALHAELGERLSGVLWTRSRSLAETTAGGETELVWGDAELPERVGELDLRISPEAFFQTNTEMADVLYGIVVEYAALEGWERVYDLYSGTGTIALTLAPRAGELWGIELSEPAVADAIAAARRNEVRNANFFAGDIRLALPELVARVGRPDVVVLDPPRAGLSAKVVRRVIDAGPRRIVYVSCNPTTLAPNAAQLVEAGWALRRVRPVDMFPQTHHVECVALLERVAGPTATPVEEREGEDAAGDVDDGAEPGEDAEAAADSG
jgi:23S rRNA (uracil1939-C5)-methyltransferase